MRQITIALMIFFTTINAYAIDQSPQKGITLQKINNSDGQEIGSYSASYALLIGASDYTNKGWPDLDSIPGELNLVAAALKSKHFIVERLPNPNAKQLRAGIQAFIDQYGYQADNRLLFYFSGHGHSMDDGAKGYLVPIDAPHPDKDPVDFKRKALDMTQIMAWARQMEAKHALFLFDSCFSGTIFKTRALQRGEIPRHITQYTAQPVRQFITAGSAGETVPARSTFTPVVIDAINGLADFNKDGYVTGTELGTYLQEKVPQFVKQTPQYGKISDYELSRGDFVFFIETANVQMPLQTPLIPEQLETESLSEIPFATSTLPPKKTPWYKNPWFWAGTVAATAGAAYGLQNNDDNPQGGIVLE